MYPYLSQFALEMNMDLEQGLIEVNDDMTGLKAILGKKIYERFFLNGSLTKVYYPRNDGDSDFTSPFTLRLKLSKKAHLYKQTVYMLTDWFIDIGGISRTLYIGGMIISHFIAARMYNKALIQALFMVQEKSVADKQTLSK